LYRMKVLEPLLKLAVYDPDALNCSCEPLHGVLPGVGGGGIDVDLTVCRCRVHLFILMYI